MSKLLEIDINRINYLMFEQTLYTGSLERTFEDPKKAQKYLDTFVIGDTHTALLVTSLVTGLLGAIPSPLSPLLLGISVAADLTDAAIYWKDGDPYTAGVLAALAVIPGHQLFKQIKNLKTLERVGIEEGKRLVELNAKNIGTVAERKTARQIMKEITDNVKQLTPLVVAETAKRIIVTLSKKSLKVVLNFIILLFKLSGGIIKITVVIGGIVYSFDKIYLAAFSDDPKLRNLRNNSTFGQLVSMVEGNSDEIKKQLLNQGNEELENKIESGEPVATTIPSDEPIPEFLNRTYEKNKSKFEPSLDTIAPSYQDVISKKIDPKTQKPLTIHKGQNGPNVTRLQTDLSNLGYNEFLTGIGEYSKGTDGKFGYWTEEAVKEFQDANQLSVDGIVGYETLNKIMLELKKLKK